MAGAVITALTTTIVSFLPVFAMQAAEGKLFKPLAFTKTFTMLAALLIGLVIIPTLAHMVFSIRFDKQKYKKILNLVLVVGGLVLSFATGYYVALALTFYGLNGYFSDRWPETKKSWANIAQHCHHRCDYRILPYQGMDAPGCKEFTVCQFLVCHCYCGSGVGRALVGSGFLSQDSEMGPE